MKTILYLPQGTPTTIMLEETGMKPVKMLIKKKKLMYAHRILNMEEERLIHKITAGNSLWRQETNQLQKEYNINEHQMNNYSKKELSKEIEEMKASGEKQI